MTAALADPAVAEHTYDHALHAATYPVYGNRATGTLTLRFYESGTRWYDDEGSLQVIYGTPTGVITYRAEVDPDTATTVNGVRLGGYSVVTVERMLDNLAAHRRGERVWWHDRIRVSREGSGIADVPTATRDRVALLVAQRVEWFVNHPAYATRAAAFSYAKAPERIKELDRLREQAVTALTDWHAWLAKVDDALDRQRAIAAGLQVDGDAPERTPHPDTLGQAPYPTSIWRDRL